MPDRYQAFTQSRLGATLVGRLGLPAPTPLRRYREGDPLLSGAFVVGGDGAVREQITRVITDAGGIVADPADPTDPEARFTGVVFDATSIAAPADLVALQRFLTPLLRRLSSCARVVVVGGTPERAGSTDARVAQRSLEGFTRSLGKEMRRGGTVQLVYVDPGAEERIASTLRFLLSAKSAYVSGQVIRVSDAVPAPDPVLPPTALRPLDGTVALVTGAARGIGESIARVLARDGATLVGVDVPQAASDLQRLMTELGGSSVLLDITAVDAPQRIARALAERHGGVDVVVHNAGITRDKKLANMTEDRWSPVIDVNLVAPQRITAELLDQKLVRSNGRVVGVSSMAGIAGNPGQTNYATSKAGVIGWVDALAAEAAELGITVNAVAPGFIETRMTAAMPLFPRESGRRLNSLSQGGLPVDVAETVAWYADPASYGVTGTVTRVCGQSLLGA